MKDDDNVVPIIKKPRRPKNINAKERSDARPQAEKDAARERSRTAGKYHRGPTYERNTERTTTPRPRKRLYDKASHEASMRGQTLEEFVADLSPEELARGQLKDQHGQWRGRQSNFVPRAFHDQCIRELMKRGEALYRQHFIAAIEMFAIIANDPDADPKDRLRAGQYIIERVQGKVPDRVEIATADPWQTIIDGIIAEVPDEVPDKASEILRAAKERFDA